MPSPLDTIGRVEPNPEYGIQLKRPCRGSRTNSSLAHLHADRFIGFGFFAVGYTAPNTSINYDELQTRVSFTHFNLDSSSVEAAF